MLKVLTLIFISLASQITVAQDCALYQPIKLDGPLINQNRPIVLTRVRTLQQLNLGAGDGDFNARGGLSLENVKLTITPIVQVDQPNFPLFHARFDGYRSYNQGQTMTHVASLGPEYDPESSMRAERYTKTEMIYNDNLLKLTSSWEGEIFFPDTEKAKFHLYIETFSILNNTWIKSIKVTYPAWDYANGTRNHFNFLSNLTDCVTDAVLENP